MKKCTRCKIEKQTTEYHKSKDRHDGLNAKCKDCAREHQRENYFRNHESKISKERARRYGISTERYLEMIKNGCEVCGLNENLHVDHDHSCCPGSFTCGNCIRGILCRGCNMAEGQLKSNPELALALYNYMTRVIK